MKRFIVALFCLFMATVSTYAQEGDKADFKDRIFFGGNFSVSFFNGIFVDISPLVGYKVTDRLSTGVGVTYQYLSTTRRDVDLSTSIYGGRVFTRYNVYRNLFLHSEYERINLEVLSFDVNDEPVIRREWVPAAFAGGGINQPLGKATISFYVLYNFLHEEGRSPYNSPVVVRAGINL